MHVQLVQFLNEHLLERKTISQENGAALRMPDRQRQPHARFGLADRYTKHAGSSEGDQTALLVHVIDDSRAQLSRGMLKSAFGRMRKLLTGLLLLSLRVGFRARRYTGVIITTRTIRKSIRSHFASHCIHAPARILLVPARCPSQPNGRGPSDGVAPVVHAAGNG